MKNIFDKSLLISSLVALALGMVSCEDPNKTPSKGNDNKYNLELTVTGGSFTYDEATKVLTLESSDEKPEFVLKGKFEGKIINNIKDAKITLDDVELTNNDGEAAIYGTAKTEISVKGSEGNKIISNGTDAAIYCEKGIELGGSGIVSIEGSIKHGVKASKVKVKGTGNYTVKGSADGSAINCNEFVVEPEKTFTLSLVDSKNGVKADNSISIESGTFTLSNINSGFKTDKYNAEDTKDALENHFIKMSNCTINKANVKKLYDTEKNNLTIDESVVVNEVL